MMIPGSFFQGYFKKITKNPRLAEIDTGRKLWVHNSKGDVIL